MEQLTLTCTICGNKFTRSKNDLPEIKCKRRHGKFMPNGYNWSGKYFCSKKCHYESLKTAAVGSCGWCDQPVERYKNQAKRSLSGNIFCSRSCSASFNNTKKRKSKRSKCEKMLFNLLSETYPTLDLVANGKSMLDGLECDVEIASLKLGIEWNGIVHYKPIYGEQKLLAIQSIDERKQSLAQEKGVRLIVIPDLVSSEKYVKEAFRDIRRIIDELLERNE